jgi:uncharacterized protein YoxC
MKKLMALMMVLLIAFTITGCKKTETGTETVAKESTELDKDINSIDQVTEELNTSDLDNLDQDLQNVNW